MNGKLKSLPDDFQTKLAKLSLGQLRSEDIVSTASEILDHGSYCDELLQVLDTNNPTFDHVRNLFEAAMRSLDVTIPSESEAANWLAKLVAKQIISGAVSPHEGARTIWWKYSVVDGVDSRLREFVGLASEYEDATQEKFRKEYERLIVEEAIKLAN